MGFIQLNKRDFKLIEDLDLNSRENLCNLAHNLNISKQAVSKKIEKFKESFLKCTAVVDIYRIGYGNVHIYFKLQGLSKEKYNHFIKEIKSVKRIVWIADLFGEFDLAISIFYHDLPDIKRVIKRIDRIIGKNIVKREIYFIDKMDLLNFRIDNVESKRMTLENKGENVKIAHLDAQILNVLKMDARTSIQKIAERVSKKPETIKKHIASLEERGVIKGYKVLVNWGKINLISGVVILHLVPGTEYGEITKRLSMEKNIPFIATTLEGNIIFDIVSKDYNLMKNFLNRLKEDYEKQMISYQMLTINHSNKYDEDYTVD